MKLATSIKPDLYNQVKRLKESAIDQNTIQSQQLGDLLQILQSGQQNLDPYDQDFIRKIFKAWRIQSLTSYDKYAVALYSIKRVDNVKRWLLQGWKKYVQRKNYISVQVFDKQNRLIKQNLLTTFQRWIEYINISSIKQVKNYKAKKFHLKSTKSKVFKAWSYYVGRKLNSIVAEEQLSIQISNKIRLKYFKLFRRAYLTLESVIQQNNIKREQEKQKQIFRYWLNIVNYKKQIALSLKQHNFDKIYQRKFQIFRHIKQRTRTHIIQVKQKQVARLGYKRNLITIGIKAFLYNKHYQQQKRVLLSIQNKRLKKLVITTLRDTKYLIDKLNYVKPFLQNLRKKQQAREFFYQLHRLSYKKFIKKCADQFRLNRILKVHFDKWNLYHQYKQKKIFVNEKMNYMHLIKLGHIVLIKWKKHNQRYRLQKQLQTRISLNHDYILKKKILNAMRF